MLYSYKVPNQYKRKPNYMLWWESDSLQATEGMVGVSVWLYLPNLQADIYLHTLMLPMEYFRLHHVQCWEEKKHQ